MTWGNDMHGSMSFLCDNNNDDDVVVDDNLPSTMSFRYVHKSLSPLLPTLVLDNGIDNDGSDNDNNNNTTTATTPISFMLKFKML